MKAKTMSEFSIAIFVNPMAGTGKYRRVLSGIERSLTRKSYPFRLYDKDWPSILDRRFSHIFVIGGDGTLNHFINQYPGTTIPISVFTAGTGNDFAWKLYGNIDLDEQLQIAVHGLPRAIDAGICNGRYFINGLGIGFDGAVVNNFISCRKWLKGNLAYYWTVLQTLSSFKSRELSLTIDEGSEQLKGRFFMITVANGSRFGGNFMVAPQSSLTDNELDLVAINSVAVLKRYFYLPRMKKGRHLSLPFVKTSKIRSVCISAKTPVAAHLDGEPMVAENFDIKMLPGHFYFRS